MKKRNVKSVLFSLAIACILGIPLLCAGDAKAYEENGFRYRVNNKKAVITGTTVKGDELVIPSEIGGFQVKGIGYRAFART